MAKILVRTKNGALARMNEVALRMAERHFGINKPRPEAKETPIELLRLPKQEIIPAVQKTVQPASETIELPKKTRKKNA